jgi:valyl-tRNA synthetase
LYESNLSQKEIEHGAADKKKKFPGGITECGTDALRFALLTYMTQGSINLEVMRVIGYREFCNKLWNIVRFALGNFPAGFQPRPDGVDCLKAHLSLSDKWILTRLSELITSTNHHFNEYKLGEMATGLYDFWKKELADVYLEATKPVMKGADGGKKEAALNTLYICLDAALKLLHPTMPYLTEELYQRLPHAHGTAANSISIAAFPTHLISFANENVDA